LDEDEAARTVVEKEFFKKLLQQEDLQIEEAKEHQCAY